MKNPPTVRLVNRKEVKLMNDNRMNVQAEIRHIKGAMVGHLYKHFKGGLYVVTDIAVHSETEEPMVIYRNFHDSSLVWCRPMSMFLSEVDHEKYPDVKQLMRFEKLEIGGSETDE